jgi:hypothetical protein
MSRSGDQTRNRSKLMAKSDGKRGYLVSIRVVVHTDNRREALEKVLSWVDAKVALSNVAEMPCIEVPASPQVA